MGSRWKGEISRTILNIFRPYNGIDAFKLRFLEGLYEKTFVVPYVIEMNLLYRTNAMTVDITSVTSLLLG